MLCMACSRASMPSIAFSAIRINSATGASNITRRSAWPITTAAPVAIDSSMAATVTWLAVTPAFASALQAGLSRSWNAGLRW